MTTTALLMLMLSPLEMSLSLAASSSPFSKCVSVTSHVPLNRTKMCIHKHREGVKVTALRCCVCKRVVSLTNSISVRQNRTRSRFAQIMGGAVYYAGIFCAKMQTWLSWTLLWLLLLLRLLLFLGFVAVVVGLSPSPSLPHSQRASLVKY